MRKHPRIVVGFDFSDAARSALEAAVRLARAAGGELVICHAFAPSEAVAMGCACTMDLLQEEAEWARGFGVPTRLNMTEGEPSHALLHVLAQERPDLCVVGTHGRHGLARVLLGSVAEAALRKAPCPVLVCRTSPRLSPREPIPGPHIVAGVDFTPESSEAVRQAAALATLLSGRLTLMHVSLQADVAHQPEAGRPLPLLEAMAGDLASQGVEARPALSYGDPARSLIAATEGDPSAVIVVGTRSRSLVARAFLGSVADYVCRHATGRVLVAHANDDHAELEPRPPPTP